MRTLILFKNAIFFLSMILVSCWSFVQYPIYKVSSVKVPGCIWGLDYRAVYSVFVKSDFEGRTDFITNYFSLPKMFVEIKHAVVNAGKNWRSYFLTDSKIVDELI